MLNAYTVGIPSLLTLSGNYPGTYVTLVSLMAKGAVSGMASLKIENDPRVEGSSGVATGEKSLDPPTWPATDYKIKTRRKQQNGSLQ